MSRNTKNTRVILRDEITKIKYTYDKKYIVYTKNTYYVCDKVIVKSSGLARLFLASPKTNGGDK